MTLPSCGTGWLLLQITDWLKTPKDLLDNELENKVEKSVELLGRT